MGRIWALGPGCIQPPSGIIKQGLPHLPLRDARLTSVPAHVCMHTRADTGVRAHPRTHPPGFPTSVIMGLQLCVRTTFPDPVSELGALWAGSPRVMLMRKQAISFMNSTSPPWQSWQVGV